MNHSSSQRPVDLSPFTEIDGFSEIKEYISYFKDPLKGVAAREARITLSEAKSLNWLKE